MVQSSPTPMFALIALTAVIVAVVLALNPRTRPAGLIILGLFVCGLFFIRGSASQVQTATVTEVGIGQPRMVVQMHGEVLKNQRLAAQMKDAVVQQSPDGTILETYPDGMQIRQLPQTLERRIVLPGDSGLQVGGHGVAVSHASRGSVGSWILFAPLLALLAAFVALRAKRPHGAGSGLAWVVGGAATLLVVGMTIIGYSWADRRSPPPTPSMAPMPPDFGAQGDLAGAYQGVIEELQGAVQQQAIQQQSLESIWSQLTAPKIDLDEQPAAEMTDSQRELASAAKVVLSASVPGADPFTQGWLANAAKAIMTASTKPKATAAQSRDIDETAMATAPSEPIEVTSVTQPVAEIAPRPRPDWVDKPPKLVGNTRRFVVSTDPYSTVEECYANLRQKMRDVVHARIMEKAAETNGGRSVYVPELEQLGLGIDYILSELCPEDDYIETVNHTFGKMLKAHALLEFTPQQDELLVDRWRSYARSASVGAVAGVSTLIVAGLSLVYGLLKVDTWTRGYYTKRLFLGVPAVIIGLLSVAAQFVP